MSQTNLKDAEPDASLLMTRYVIGNIVNCHAFLCKDGDAKGDKMVSFCTKPPPEVIGRLSLFR